MCSIFYSIPYPSTESGIGCVVFIFILMACIREHATLIQQNRDLRRYANALHFNADECLPINLLYTNQ